MASYFSHNVVLSCEHAGNEIPAVHKKLFRGYTDILESHRGWDPGALLLTEIIAGKLYVSPFIYPFTRLLIEPNRSEDHPRIFSDFSKNLAQEHKKKLLSDYYHDFRNKVQNQITDSINTKGPVIHISVHTFTPHLNGRERNFDIGMLYDPKRYREKLFCKEWKERLAMGSTELSVRMNRPYKGTSDGFTTYLRKQYPEENYLGIELEVNQKFWKQGGENWEKVCLEIADSLNGGLAAVQY